MNRKTSMIVVLAAAAALRPMRRHSRGLGPLAATACLTLFAPLSASPGWAASKRECQQQCQAAIGACEDQAGKFAPGLAKKFRRTCKKAVLKACRKGDLGICADSATLVCAQPPPPTSTITITTTTTTLAFPATGQTTCWDPGGMMVPCEGTGQDGDFHSGAPLAYRDNGDGTVTDLNTGLMWEKKSDDGSIHDQDTTYSWAEAFTVHVAGLNSSRFAGYTDWRLPNVRELQSIVDYGRTDPAVDPVFNSNCAPGCTVTTCSCAGSLAWSSTSIADDPSEAWLVAIAIGDLFRFLPKSNIATDVRAVRGGL